jgi:hypothetical protein
VVIPQWRVVREAGPDDGGVVVLIDFESSATEPGLVDCAQRLAVSCGLWQPGAASIPQTAVGRDFVAQWARELVDAGVEVHGVFGYCASGPLACGLAQELTVSGARPQVVLVDPHDVYGGMVRHQFGHAINQFARVVEAEQLEELNGQAREICLAGDPDWPLILQRLPVLYRQVAAAALPDPDEVDAVDELCGRYLAYLYFLLAARELGHDGIVEADIAVFSAGSQRPAGFRGRVLLTEVSRDALLTDPATINVINDVYSRHTTAVRNYR